MPRSKAATYERLADFDNVKCGAPIFADKKFRMGKVVGRCGKPLVRDGHLYEGFGLARFEDRLPKHPGKRCADGHLSLTCPKCKTTAFAVVPYPRGYHETWIGTYFCRACRTEIYSDEGCDPNAGEII